MSRNLILVVMTGVILFTTGCASIVSRSTYSVRITSSPSGANVSVKNEAGAIIQQGTTPMTTMLSSSSGIGQPTNYKFEIGKEGYTTKVTSLSAQFNVWFLGNIIFFPGFIIDYATGAMWRMDEFVYCRLSPCESSKIGNANIEKPFNRLDDKGSDVQGSSHKEIEKEISVPEGSSRITFIIVQDIKTKVPQPNVDVHFSSFDVTGDRWIDLTAKTDLNGRCSFLIPTGEQGESPIFVFSFKQDSVQALDEIQQVQKKSRTQDNFSFRIPPGKQRSLEFLADGKKLSNTIGSFQMIGIHSLEGKKPVKMTSVSTQHGNRNAITIKVTSAITTSEKQVFTSGKWSIGVDAKLQCGETLMTPDKCNPPGKYFGIVTCSISNQGETKVELKNQDITVSRNGKPLDRYGELKMPNDNAGFLKDCGLNIGGKTEGSFKTLIVIPDDTLEGISLRVGNQGPINLSFTSPEKPVDAKPQKTESEKDLVQAPISATIPHLPPYQTILQGLNTVRVRNPNNFTVSVGIRADTKGINFTVPANGVKSVSIPDGRFDVFFLYSNQSEALFQGDSFTLSGNGVEISIVQAINGNFGIRKVK